MSGAAIEARALSKSYGGHAVVRDLSLAVSSGEIFGFLGPNGSGKSTTIKMLCGLVEPSGGSASICDLDIRNQGDAVRRTIGYMSQQFSLYEDLTVEENLEFYGRAYELPRERRRKRIDELIGFSSLEPFRRQLAGTLSGGWKQRLALAAALLHEPRVLFLDEPTAGIDPVARRDLWDLLFRLSEQGVALFVTTHYMDEAERCARVGYIYDGRLIALGTREELKHLPGVTPAGTTRYSVAARDGVARRDGVALLGDARGKPYVRDATIFGDALHLVVDGNVSAEQVAHDLGVPADAVEPIEPSLEDVFVALTREKHPA
ncbi:MAG TPA: ABC transporter ATP-binding protein [Candidatus Elarobacter sp.]|nr:ABC transporter ATP-binding protein [Candidatus Elarobacter sp.]